MAPTRGQQYRLKISTIAMLTEDGKRTTTHIPADATIAVLESLTASNMPNRQVQVQWIGQTLLMFAVDILERGEPL